MLHLTKTVGFLQQWFIAASLQFAGDSRLVFTHVLGKFRPVICAFQQVTMAALLVDFGQVRLLIGAPCIYSLIVR